MRYTVRNYAFVLIIFYVIAALLLYYPVKIVVHYLQDGLAFDDRFYILAGIIIITILFLLVSSLPKVIVFDDYVLVRYFLIYIRYPYTDLTYMETVEKVMDFHDGTGKDTYKETIFYKNGRKLFKLSPGSSGYKRFIFEWQQRNLKAHLK